MTFVEAEIEPLPDRASVPALISVLPRQVFTPVSVRVLASFLVTEPAPDMVLLTVASLVWLKISAPLLVKFPAGRLPLASLLPHCNVAPALMLAPPLMALLALSRI